MLRHRFTLFLAILAGLPCLTAASASACARTWTGAGADNKASNANNWSVCPPAAQPAVPGQNDDVTIEGASVSINLDTGLSVHSWSMAALPSSHVTLSGRVVSGNTGIAAPGGFTNGPGGTIVLDGGNGPVSIASATGGGSGLLANEGSITLEQTAPTGAAGPPQLIGNLTNTGTISVQTRSEYQGGYILDNKGAINLAAGVVFTGTGAGPSTVINDAAGSFNGTGDGNFQLPNGTFEQGAGTTTGSQPVILVPQAATLDFTGTGRSHLMIIGGANVTGGPAAEQSLTLVATQGNSISTATGDIVNHGAIVIDGSRGDVSVDMRDHTLTNDGTLTLMGGSASGLPHLLGDLTNAGTLSVDSNAQLAGGTGPTTTLAQTAGSTLIAAGATFDFGHAQAGFTITGGRVSGSGILQGSAVTNTGGVVAPGLAGPLTIQGTYSQSGSGQLAIAVNGPTPAHYGRLAVSGDVSLGGVLRLSPSPSFAAAAKPGAQIVPLSYGGSRTGSFGGVVVSPPLKGCRAFALAYADATKQVIAIVHRLCAALTLSHVSLAPAAFAAKAGSTLKATLSAAATLKIAITQRVEAPCGPRKLHRRCPRTVVRRHLTLKARAGANRLPFKVPGLAAGRYTATIVAVGSGGARSRPVSLGFRIKKHS